MCAEWWLHPQTDVLVLLVACIVAGCVAAGIIFVLYGPVPVRRSALVGESLVARPSRVESVTRALDVAAIDPAAIVFHTPSSMTPPPELIHAPPPPPVHARPEPAPPTEARPAASPARVHATPMPPTRPRPTLDPGLLPVVRGPRGADLPPLRRVARGTAAPPLFLDEESSTTAEVPVFEVDELTQVEYLGQDN